MQMLQHEMIHTYLMHTNTEDEYDQHGANFIAKMYEINSLARLNITVLLKCMAFEKRLQFNIIHFIIDRPITIITRESQVEKVER